MRECYTNPNITIEPADKGGSLVIMNCTDYIAEAKRQLSNPDNYQSLFKDPTKQFKKYIHLLIDQALRCKIIDDTTKITFKTKILE